MLYICDYHVRTRLWCSFLGHRLGKTTLDYYDLLIIIVLIIIFISGTDMNNNGHINSLFNYSSTCFLYIKMHYFSYFNIWVEKFKRLYMKQQPTNNFNIL